MQVFDRYLHNFYLATHAFYFRFIKAKYLMQWPYLELILYSTRRSECLLYGWFQDVERSMATHSYFYFTHEEKLELDSNLTSYLLK